MEEANIDGTTPGILLLKAWNRMTDDEMMCRPKMQLKYVKTKSNVDSEDMTLICCHKALIAALIPFHAPVTSCMAMSFCLFAMAADNVSRWVMNTKAAVYAFSIQPSLHCPLNKVT